MAQMFLGYLAISINIGEISGRMTNQALASWIGTFATLTDIPADFFCHILVWFWTWKISYGHFANVWFGISSTLGKKA